MSKCRVRGSLRCYAGRNVRQFVFVIFGVNYIIYTLPQMSQIFCPISVDFRYIWGRYPPLEVKGRRLEPPAAQRRLCDDFLRIWVSFRGAWRGTLGVILEAGSQIRRIISSFWRFFRSRKKERKRSSQGGVGTCNPLTPAYVS